MSQRIQVGELRVDAGFHNFVENELLPGLSLSSQRFWNGLQDVLSALTDRNRELLAERERLQGQIDQYHLDRRGQPWDAAGYKRFLEEIGYLVPTGEDFTIATRNVDSEIARVAGPQLVVPVSNPRYALNAANARWGSLYDALYGTDVISEDGGAQRGGEYNPVRGERVIARAAEFLDEAVPLDKAHHARVLDYEVNGNVLQALLDTEELAGLMRPEQFVGQRVEGSRRVILLRNNGLHIELVIDPEHPVGRDAGANLADVVLESALTTIQDCEDSVAAVDAEDKTAVYRNWLGLMMGTLSTEFDKGGRSVSRSLAPDRQYTDPRGELLTLPGRALMLVRNVGHLMTNDTVLDAEGNEVFEGLLDAFVTGACALHDIMRTGQHSNSRTGSVYIVKPKMHGPAEAALTNDLFDGVEDALGLARHTLKVGVMDEERRTTVNLFECIRAVKDRIVFINTGFLDRTGDEIHTSMQAGAVLPKEAIKQQPWIAAYEDWNVDVGIRCGFPGRAQIGKGMWPKPDEMRQMVDTKAGHPQSGASCAWVPSPTAATLHAMHYHSVKVAERQQALANRDLASLDDILTPPLGDPSGLSPQQIQDELDNNAQGILGYVVRWIDHGVGCSKVPDINDVGLMEDRATCRISSQHMANWLLHGVCTEDQVRETMQRMAAVVDRQNAADPAYQPMAPDFDESIAFQAACDLVFKGVEQPSGYTEPLLHRWRKEKKEPDHER